MKVRTAAPIVFAAFAAPLLTACERGEAAESPIEGAWSVVSSKGTDSANPAVQPSLYLFTDRHYSMMRVNGTAPRPDLPADLANAKASDILAVYGNAFTAQSGTYELSRGKLTIHALVAKDPGPMASGSFNTSTYKLDGSTLTITQVITNNGPIANPTTWKLARVE